MDAEIWHGRPGNKILDTIKPGPEVVQISERTDEERSFTKGKVMTKHAKYPYSR